MVDDVYNIVALTHAPTYYNQCYMRKSYHDREPAEVEQSCDGKQHASKLSFNAELQTFTEQWCGLLDGLVQVTDP